MLARGLGCDSKYTMKLKLNKPLGGGEILTFFCTGCQENHSVQTAPRQPAWTWNGSLDNPTISPSVLVTIPAVPDAGPGFEEYLKDRRCHLFVSSGQLQYLNDCTHSLAGQTVDMVNTGDI